MMHDYFLIVINIILAIILGRLLDFYINKLPLDPMYRVIIQFIVIIGTIFILDVIYNKIFNRTLSTDNIFFISVFLGVQSQLFKNISS